MILVWQGSKTNGKLLELHHAYDVDVRTLKEKLREIDLFAEDLQWQLKTREYFATD